MQRRKYYDYAESVELGQALSHIPVAQMRRFAMKKLLKVFVCVILIYIGYTIYEKMNMARSFPSKSASINADIDVDVNEMLQEAEQDEEKRNKDINAQKDTRWKENVNKVFQEMKQKHALKEKDLLKEDANVKVEDNLPVRKDPPEKKVPDEQVVGKGVRIEDILDADEIKAAHEGRVIDTGDVQENGQKKIEGVEVGQTKKPAADDMELEKEIEEILAESLKDAVNDVADEQDDPKKAEQGQPGQAEDTVDKKEFKEAEEHVAQRLNPQQVEELKKHINGVMNPAKTDDDHELPPFVTAVGRDTFKQVLNLISSIQSFMPKRKIYVYDLDLPKEEKRQLATICSVKLRLFMKLLFPNHVASLKNFHWRPLIIQVALAEFGHIFWINPDLQLKSNTFGRLVHDSHEAGVLLIGEQVSFSTLAVTHPDMYNFIPTDKDRLMKNNHYEMQALIIHNTDKVHENFMKVITACALEEACLAPPGSQRRCQFDFSGRKYADCHRYDESAINLVLQNWFNFDTNKYAREGTIFRKYTEHMKPKLKFCRNIRDIKDSEL